MTQQQWIFSVSLVLGSLLVLAQIVVSVLAYKKAKVALTPTPSPTPPADADAAELAAFQSAAIETARVQAISEEKAIDLLKTLASAAPLLVGGLILIGLAALTSGSLVFEATTQVGS